ncbi:flagellar filament capping protein FliD [Candidatus Nitrospira bockiana]
MQSISFGGLGNGIDFQTVVSQLVDLQRLPIDRLSDKKKVLQDRLTDYKTLGTDLLSLQSAARKLRRSTDFDRTSASVSDDDILTATGGFSAAPGTYTVRITQLATSHQVASKAAKTVASTTDDIVAGASAMFTFTVGGGAAQTVTLGDTATLEDLKTAINDLGAGVSASILNTGTDDAPAYRLVLTGTSTGASNAIAVTADTTTLDFVNSSGTGGVDTLQAAQDAIVSIGDPAANPVTVQRSTNTITDAIAGVTLSLKSTTAAGSTATVSVSRDTASLKTDITALVDAYNKIVKFINERNTYDTETKKRGLFFAEGTAKTVLSRLRTALSDEVAGLSELSSLGALGVKTERDGTITVDAAALEKALNENYTGVKNLFIGQTNSTGLAQRIYDAVDGLDDVEYGALTLRQDSLTDEIDDLTDDIRRKEDAVAEYEDRLKRQYAALDALLRRLQGQLDYLKAQE